MFHLVSSHKKRLQVRQSLFNCSQHETTKAYDKMKNKNVYDTNVRPRVY